MQILLTGDPISAARAYEIGLVNEVVPAPDLRPGRAGAGRADRRQRPAVGAGGQAHGVPVAAIPAGDAFGRRSRSGSRCTRARTRRKGRPRSGRSAARSGRAADARRHGGAHPPTWRPETARARRDARAAAAGAVAAAAPRPRAGPSATRSATWPTSTRPRCWPSATRSRFRRRPRADRPRRRLPRRDRRRVPPPGARGAALLVPARPAGPAGRFRGRRSGGPAALVRAGHGRRLVGHRPADGDLGTRPGHRRRARHPAAADRAAAAHRAPRGGAGCRYSFAVRGLPRAGQPPSGWSWRRRTAASGPGGRTDAADRVSGAALDFCLLVTQRRHRADTGLVITGPDRRRSGSDRRRPSPGAPGPGRAPRARPRRAGPAAGRGRPRPRRPGHGADRSRPRRSGSPTPPASTATGCRGPRDGRGRPDRRPDRRLPGRADHADPVEGAAEGPGRRLRAHRAASWSRCSAPAWTAASRSSSTPAASTRPAWPREFAALAERLGLHPRIAYVTGDDLLPRLGRAARQRARPGQPRHRPAAGAAAASRSPRTPTWAAGASPRRWRPAPTSSSARGSPTRRWSPGRPPGGTAGARDDWDQLAGAVIAGHVIECGPQATGGNYSFLDEITDRRYPGFPIAEVRADGSASSPSTRHRRAGLGRHRHRPAALRDRRARLRQPGRGRALRHGPARPGRPGPGPHLRHPGQPAAGHGQGRR